MFSSLFSNLLFKAAIFVVLDAFWRAHNGGFGEPWRRFRGSYAEVSGNPFGPCDYKAALMRSITIANENRGEGIRRQRVGVLHGLIPEVSGKQTEAK